MGTHPIFESDFDCLTESLVLFPQHARSSSFCHAQIGLKNCCQTLVCFCCQSRYRYRRQIHWCRSCYRRCCWIRSRNRNCVRIFDHWLRSKPILESSVVFLRYFGICPFRSHGTFLLDGCFLDPVCSLNALMAL